MKLCSFNDTGVATFRQYLGNVRAGVSCPTLLSLVTEKSLVVEQGPEVPDVCPVFSKKIEMVLWLHEHFKAGSFQPDERSVGLWTWLAAYMFESICRDIKGALKLKADSHYILDVLDFRRTYRHLIASPWRLHGAAGAYSQLFLNEMPSVHGELMEQGMSRLFLMRIPAVAEIMERLYLDPETGRARRGIMPKQEKRGDFRNRFPRRIQQLMLTYDLMSMNAEQLLVQLGPEFNGIGAR